MPHLESKPFTPTPLEVFGSLRGTVIPGEGPYNASSVIPIETAGADHVTSFVAGEHIANANSTTQQETLPKPQPSLDQILARRVANRESLSDIADSGFKVFEETREGYLTDLRSTAGLRYRRADAPESGLLSEKSYDKRITKLVKYYDKTHDVDGSDPRRSERFTQRAKTLGKSVLRVSEIVARVGSELDKSVAFNTVVASKVASVHLRKFSNKVVQASPGAGKKAYELSKATYKKVAPGSAEKNRARIDRARKLGNMATANLRDGLGASRPEWDQRGPLTRINELIINKKT